MFAAGCGEEVVWWVRTRRKTRRWIWTEHEQRWETRNGREKERIPGQEP